MHIPLSSNRNTNKYVSLFPSGWVRKSKQLQEAISRWETGKGLPDTSLLKPLGDILGVSVGELLSGKIIEEAEMKDQTDRIILDSLKYSSRMLANMVNLVLSPAHRRSL